MKLITLHTSPSVAIENRLTQMFKALVPLVLNFSRSSKVRIAAFTTSRYPWHPRSVKMVRWHHVTPLCPTPVRGSSRGAQGCQQMYSRDLDPSSRQPDERTQKYIIAYHVYAYGRKTVRAFCFFLEYCSLSWGWGGVGWGGMLTFLVLRTWSIAMLLRSLGSLTTWHVATLLRSLVWVGVGWGGGAC